MASMQYTVCHGALLILHMCTPCLQHVKWYTEYQKLDHTQGSIQAGTYLTSGEDLCLMNELLKLSLSAWLNDDTCEADISCAMALQVLDSVMAAGIPIAGNIGGGYHPDLTVLARRHCLLHWAATQMFVDHKL